jgi:hypothetical protein
MKRYPWNGGWQTATVINSSTTFLAIVCVQIHRKGIPWVSVPLVLGTLEQCFGVSSGACCGICGWAAVLLTCCRVVPSGSSSVSQFYYDRSMQRGGGSVDALLPKQHQSELAG